MTCPKLLHQKSNYMLMMCYYVHLLRTITDCQNLQDDLSRLVQWADRWQMSFNFAKCEMIKITNRINPGPYAGGFGRFGRTTLLKKGPQFTL